MDERKSFEEFSLLGGPLHRLGCRLGLVRRGTNTVLLGLALGLISWTVLVVLAFIEGVSQKLFSLSVIGGHIRLLAVIPLFFLCESMLDPRLTAFVRMIVRSGVVPPSTLPALETEIARTVRWKDAWPPEALCLLAAVLLTFIEPPSLLLSGITAVHDTSHALAEPTLAAMWYWTVCLTLIRFLLFRWIWRLVLWTYFLWHLSRLELNPMPTHPDGVAWLGYLEVVQMHFIPLIAAISLILSASLAEEVSTGLTSFEAIYPEFPLVLILDAVLFLGPLCFITTKLWVRKAKALNVLVGSVNANKRHWYKAAEILARADRKWLRRLITRIEKPENFQKALERQPGDIKVVIQFSEI
jgi:hypothetical protein